MSSAAKAWEFSRRAALGVVGAGMLGAAAWPVRSRSRSGVPSGRVVIDYWEKWTGAEGEAIQRVCDRFNRSQERIWVRRLPVSETGTKAMVAIGGGDPPDVVGLFSYHIALYAQTGAAMSFDEFASRSVATGAIDPSIYLPSVRSLLSYEGKQWGAITTCFALALYCNRALLREAGLDPSALPDTLTALDAAADRLTLRSASGAITRAGFLPNLPSWWPYSWPVLFGGALFDAASNRAVLTDAPTLAAYEWVQSYPRRFGADHTAAFAQAYDRAYHSAQDPFISGRVAMIAQGPWLAGFIRAVAPDLDFAVAPLPAALGIATAEQPTGMVEGDILVIPRGCRHPEEAFEFVRFTQRQDVLEQLARDHAKSSPLAKYSPGFFADHPNGFAETFDRVLRSPRVRIAPQTSQWKGYASLIGGAMDSIWRGGDVRSELARVERRAQEMLDKAARMRAKREELASGRRR